MKTVDNHLDNNINNSIITFELSLCVKSNPCFFLHARTHQMPRAIFITLLVIKIRVPGGNGLFLHNNKTNNKQHHNNNIIIIITNNNYILLIEPSIKR